MASHSDSIHPRGREEVDLPDEAAIRASVSRLTNHMVSKIEEEVGQILPDIAPDCPRDPLALQLTKLQIMAAFNKEARSDYTGVVAEARRAGGTWDLIGAVLGTTKQAAYERWSKAVKTLDEGAEWSKAEAEKPADPVREFAPTLHLEKADEKPRRRRA